MSSRSVSADARVGGAPVAAWSRRAWSARVLRAVLFVAPFVAGWLAIRLLQRWFLRPEGWLGFGLWLVQAVLVALVATRIFARVSNRLTPLPALLEMTLVFPDHAPSRFKLALRRGSVKKLLAAPELALSSNAQAAAEQAMQLVQHLAQHDPLTRGHTERVRAYADVIGQEMGLSADDQNKLRWGALLHDVGKLSVPPEILNKPGKPTAEEWEILRGHPAAAAELLKPLEAWLGDWLLAAYEHHERWDGAGYPNGLAGEAISLAGRITAVADAYDVITSRRSYKAPISAASAREELVGSAGSHFDPTVVRAMLKAGLQRSTKSGWFGWILELPSVARLASSGAAVAPAAAAAAVVIAAVGSAATTQVSTIEGSAREVPGVVVEEASPPTTIPSLLASPPRLTRLASDSVVPTTALDSTTTVSSATSVPVEGSTPGPAPAATSTTTSAPASSTTSVAPTPTTTTTTTSTSTTSTTSTPADDCSRLQSGNTEMAGSSLAGCDLRGINLDGATLTGADLSGANLANVRLTNFDLLNANLAGANLVGANFNDGSMEGANLTGANVTGLTVVNTHMGGVLAEGMDFRQSTFTGVTFGGSELQGSNFAGVGFTSVDFNGANVSQVNFASADMVGLQFFGSIATGAVFADADLSQSQLDGANLSTAILDRAVMRSTGVGGIILNQTSMVSTDFAGSYGSPSSTNAAIFAATVCPDGIIRDVSCW